MKHLYYLLLLCLLACSPENEQVQDEHIQVAPPAEALDTIANTVEDGVRTDEEINSPTLPLPPALLRLLSERYPDWQTPAFLPDAIQNAAKYTNSPAVVRGNFNSDNLQDIALQLQKAEDVVMVAAMQRQDSSYELVEMMEDILFNERGHLKSPYYMYRIPKGEQVQDPHNMNEIELPYDAVAIGIGRETTVYFYLNGSFVTYALEE